MPTIKNLSARPYHIDATMLLPQQEMEIDDDRLDSKPMQALLDTHELAVVEQKPAPKAKTAETQPLPTKDK